MSRRVLIGGMVVIAAGVAVVVVGIPLLSDDTFCTGSFPTEQADRAIDEAEEAGFSFDEREERRSRISIIVRSGTTGDDAEDLVEEWKRILDRYEGRAGEPPARGGCWERGPGD